MTAPGFQFPRKNLLLGALPPTGAEQILLSPEIFAPPKSGENHYVNPSLHPSPTGKRRDEVRGRPSRPPTWTRRTAWALFGCQLLVMFVYSAVEYRSYGLGRDFGTHAQAWVAIAHGNLNPWTSLYNVPFWKNNGEFLFWPLAFMYYLYPHAVDLLWVQDVLVVATEVVAFVWVTELLQRSRASISARTASLTALGVCVALVLNPWCYETLAFDYHSQASTALFVLLAIRAFSSGRNRQLFLWVPLTLLSAGLGGLAIAATGISGVIAGRATRRFGIVLLGIGLAWFLLLSQLGAVSIGGNYLNYWYGYLVHSKGHVSMFAVVLGAVNHPGAALHMAAGKWNLILLFLLVSGAIGVIWPWALPMTLVIILPSALNQDVYFLLRYASFQTWPALPLVLVGSVAIIIRMTAMGSHGRKAARFLVAGWIAALVPLAAVGIPEVPNYWLAVSGKATADLSHIDASVSSNTELIVSEGVIGRFAEHDRSQVYNFFWLGNSFPVTRKTVVFVITIHQGVMHIPTWQVTKVMRYVVHQLGATEISARDGVYEFVWKPDPGIHRVVLA